ncbi:MAG: SCO family protein [Candidatus Kapaibacterium sp.]|nr:SCO family protein [Ignavibacteriota bacterium]MCB9220280.1 SCO family protein [Ignavibacteria bacterium]
MLFKNIVLCLLLPAILFAQEEANKKVGVEEKLNDYISKDLIFTNSDGKKVNLLEQFDGKPAVISMVYFNCPGICSPLLEGFAEVIESTDLIPGQDYNAFSISFDHNEDSEISSKWKKNYLAGLQREINPDGWKFMTGDSLQIHKLTKSLGFNFSKEGEKDYLHSAVLVVLSPDGKITRYHNGTEFLPFNFKMSIIEANKGLAQPTINNFLEMCFKYDPEGRTYVLNLLPIVGGTVTLTLLIFIGYLIFSSKKEKNKLETVVK